MFIRNLKHFAGGMVILAPLGALAYYAAFMLRFDGQLRSADALLFSVTLAWVLLIKLAAIAQTQLHLEFNRYVSFRDILSITKAVTLGSIGITLFDTMVLSNATIPRSIVLLDWGISLLLLSAVRTLPRLIRDNPWRSIFQKTGTRILLVGADNAGEMLLRSIRSNPELQYLPVGFIDDRIEVQGRRIAGLPVLGNHQALAQVAREQRVQEVLLTAGALPGKQIRKLMEMGNEHQFRVKVLPSYEQLLHDKVALNPRPVAIADLLRRPSVEIDTQRVSQWVTGCTVLVTGSAGSIGSEICRQILSLNPAKLIVIDRTETGQFFLERELRRLFPEAKIEVAMADLTDRDRLSRVFADHRPHIIFHAAAYKHVPLMEAHVGEAIKNIVLATRHLVDLAEEFEAEGLVMISTDKAVNPTSVMGSCKRLAEQYVQAKAATSSCRLITVRFGNVLDSAGSVVPIFRDQIARGGPVTVTHPEMVRYFMLIPEAAQLVVQAGAMGQGGEVFVLDMGEPVKIVDLAKDMIRLSGLCEGHDIEIEFSGLRPGEKLYEELYSNNEEHRTTEHKKIMVADSEPRNLLEVLSDIGHLVEIANEPNEQIRAALAEVIPIQAAPESLPAIVKFAA